MKLARSHWLLATMLAALPVSALLAVPAASAQITVFDPSNYTQNLITAARALQQINNQVQSLQHEATMLANMAKNLTPTAFPQLQQLTDKLQQIQSLMQRAQAIDFDVGRLDAQFDQLFPRGFDASLGSADQVALARTRIDAAVAAWQQTMRVQAQVVGNVEADARLLAEIAARSQGSQGALDVAQAGNQLLALTAKQQLQLQAMMAAQYRADAIEAARKAEAEANARGATKKFLGSGSAYSPLPPRP